MSVAVCIELEQAYNYKKKYLLHRLLSKPSAASLEITQVDKCS